MATWCACPWFYLFTQPSSVSTVLIVSLQMRKLSSQVTFVLQDHTTMRHRNETKIQITVIPSPTEHAAEYQDIRETSWRSFSSVVKLQLQTT